MTQIKMEPIATAPVRAGEDFGPCVLAPGIDYDFTIGSWSGDAEAWFEQGSGEQLDPEHWRLLPPLTDLTASDREDQSSRVKP